jgi:TRAP-type C4-dicarboxylate transport system permease small subunit
MELVINYLSQKQRAILNIVTSAISTLVFLALTWFGIQSVIFFAKTGHYMPTDLEPPTYLIISVIPLGSFLLFIQGIRKTFEYLRTMRSAPSGSD